MDLANHWNKVYRSNPIASLGWYEEYASPSIELISKCNLDPDDPIIDVGAGASSLMKTLIENGYRNLFALDISNEALTGLKESLAVEQDKYVRFIQVDIRSPEWVSEVGEVTLWHDRALLHFLTEASDREEYVDRLRSTVKINGFVVIGAFSLAGARRCSGLPVHRYSAESLSGLLGDAFRLVESLDYIYRQPGGDTRPYIYTRFQML